nr:hypothetical protein [Candidatus Bathyarchaeota archaeon]
MSLKTTLRKFIGGLRELKVVVQPCSGFGKVYGVVAREAVRILAEKLRPGRVTYICLPRLVCEDEEARKLIKENPCITVDGCASRCARELVDEAGGKLLMSLSVVEVLRENRRLKPNPHSLISLDDKGCKLAEKVAEKLALEVDRILGV